MQATRLLQHNNPPAYSNTTTHHKTNHKHHNYNAYKYWNQIKEHNCY